MYFSGFTESPTILLNFGATTWFIHFGNIKLQLGIQTVQVYQPLPANYCKSNIDS